MLILYLQQKEPPLEYTYGEFDIPFFALLLDTIEKRRGASLDGCVFCDIGAGSGRLVLTASALYDWKECRGIEILEGIYQHSVDLLSSCQTDDNYYLPSNQHNSKQLSNINLQLGSFTDPYITLHDIDIFFVFSSCMSKEILQSLAESLGRQVKVGSYIITTDYPLPLNGIVGKSLEEDENVPFGGEYNFEIVDVIDGDCAITGMCGMYLLHVLIF